MTWNKRAFPAVALALLIASPAAAQVAGRPYEISGQAGALVFDSRAFTRNGPAAAATLGWRAFPWITLEAQGMAGIGRVDTLRTKENVKFATFGLDLRWNLRPADSRVVPYVLTGGAYALSNVVGHAPTNLERGSGSLGLGALYNIAGPRTYLRLQARDVFFREREALEFSNHFALTAGIQYVLGGKFHDQDLDGARDWLDRCPDTPIGAKVDAHGCPVDTDGDGVFDGLDKCADTPAGATVDATGCPADTDKDGVYDGIDQCADTPAGVTVDAKGCPVDTDKDGVDDARDKCPDTPAGAVVDPTGCPVDSDHDGVFDGLDQCPNTPAGATVNPAGCPADTDGDGVLDGIDKCPGTPAGVTVDANGCPPVTRDSDRDGVPDDRDKCPGTPAGTAVDQNGCMVLFREERAAPAPGVPTPGAPAPRPTLILQGVHFQTGRSVLTLDSYVVLDQVAGSLIANPEIRIEIAGYTDSTGSLAVNTRLSNARALAVQNYLARKGVRPFRMMARGYGPANPVAPNATAAGRAENRRVELHKLP